MKSVTMSSAIYQARLVIETGGELATFRLLDDGFAERAATTWQRQDTNREAVVILDRFLNDNHLSLSDIKAIYIQIGTQNGSFTGLRLGVGIAMGLGYALEVATIPFEGAWSLDRAKGLEAVSPEQLRPRYYRSPAVTSRSA